MSPPERRDGALREGTPKGTASWSVDYYLKLQNESEAADDASRLGDIPEGSSGAGSPRGGSSRSVASLGMGSLGAGSNVSISSLGVGSSRTGSNGSGDSPGAGSSGNLVPLGSAGSSGNVGALAQLSFESLAEITKASPRSPRSPWETGEGEKRVSRTSELSELSELSGLSRLSAAVSRSASRELAVGRDCQSTVCQPRQSTHFDTFQLISTHFRLLLIPRETRLAKLIRRSQFSQTRHR